MSNVNIENLKTNNEMQDQLIKEAEMIVENGMGGLESFVSQFNNELILGTYTPAYKVAELMNIKDMKHYTRPTDASDSSKTNYKYQRITHFGAEKVTAKDFPKWIQEKYGNLSGDSESPDKLDVKLVSTPSNREKIYNVKGIQVSVNTQGTWFFTNEAFIACAMVSETKEAETIIDKFMQFAKMGEIQSKNAKVLAETLETADANLKAEGKSIQEYLSPTQYLDALKAKTSAEFITFTPEWFNKVKEMLEVKIKEVENEILDIDENIAEYRKERRNTTDEDLKMDLQDKIDELDFANSKKSSEKERYNKLLHKVKDQQKEFDDIVKTAKSVETDKLMLMRDYVRIWNKNYPNYKLTDSDAFTVLIELGIFEKDAKNYHPTTKFDWMYSSCGIFPKPGKAGTASSTFNKFGFRFLNLIFKKYFSAKTTTKSINDPAAIYETKKFIAKKDLKALSNVEALLYGKDIKQK